MKKKLLSWSIVGVSFVFLFVLTIHLVGSLWFLGYLLGDEPGKYTVGYYNAFVASNIDMKSIENSKHSFIPRISDQYSRFVYKKGEDGEYIAGIPRISDQLSVSGTLREQGWESTRIGLIVIASKRGKPSVPNYSIGYAIKGTLMAVFLDRLPVRPLLVLRSDAKESAPFSLYVEKNRKGLHGVINTQNSDFLRVNGRRIKNESIPVNLTYVPIQRDVLQPISDSFLSVVERKISDSMHFKKTHPQLIGGLLDVGPVALAFNGNSAAIGVLSSNTQSATLMTNWINDEHATRHPVKRPFSLPDKTLGYEYIPGVKDAYFNLSKANNNCLPTEKYDERLFLCGKDQAVALASEEEVGNQLVSLIKDKQMNYRGVIQGDVIKAIGLSDQFEKIEYVILDETIEVWVNSRMQ